MCDEEEEICQMDPACSSQPDYCSADYSCSTAYSPRIFLDGGSPSVLREGYAFLQKTGEPVDVLSGSSLLCPDEYIFDFQIYSGWKTVLVSPVSFPGISFTAFHRRNCHGIHYTQVLDPSVSTAIQRAACGLM